MRSIDSPWELDTHYFVEPDYSFELNANFNGNLCKIFLKSGKTVLELASALASYFEDGCLDVKIDKDKRNVKFWFSKGKIHREELPALITTTHDLFSYEAVYYVKQGLLIENYVNDDGIYYKTIDYMSKTKSITPEEFLEHYSKA